MATQLKRSVNAGRSTIITLLFTYIVLFVFWALLISMGGAFQRAYYASIILLAGYVCLYKIFSSSAQRIDKLYIFFLLSWCSLSAVSHLYYAPGGETTMYFGSMVNISTQFFLNTAVLLVTMRLADDHLRVNKKMMHLLLLLVVLSSAYYLWNAVQVAPDIARMRGHTEKNEFVTALFGVPTYAIVFGYAVILPVFCEYYLCKRLRMRWIEKLTLLLIIAAMVMIVFRSAYATATLALGLGMIVLVYKRLSPTGKVLLLLLALPVGVLLTFSDLLSESLLAISDAVRDISPTWAMKFNELGIAAHSQGSVQGDMSVRSQLYWMSLQAFFQSPILGNTAGTLHELGGHAAMLDVLGQTGLIGFSLYLGVIITAFKRMRKFPTYAKHKSTVIACYVIYIAVALTKNTITALAIHVALFEMLPILYRVYFEEEK